MCCPGRRSTCYRQVISTLPTTYPTLPTYSYNLMSSELCKLILFYRKLCELYKQVKYKQEFVSVCEFKIF